ncbi:MAG: M28 family peptidase [Gemmatimonadetes bacterium]|nr:M28 family peptidase [Gemmatimonadota bacterium]
MTTSGLDVAGKTLVMLVNDPLPRHVAVWGLHDVLRWALDPQVRAGTEEHRGAWRPPRAREIEAAGYPFTVVQGKTSEQFDLATPNATCRAPPWRGGSPSTSQGVRKMAGQDFDALKASAATRDFAGAVRRHREHHAAQQAPHRRFGQRGGEARGEPIRRSRTRSWCTRRTGITSAPDAGQGDSIYNGGLDNATGTAGLLAMAGRKAMPAAPKRSIVFLAVTAEERGWGRSTTGFHYPALSAQQDGRQYQHGRAQHLGATMTWWSSPRSLGADDYASAAPPRRGASSLLPTPSRRRATITPAPTTSPCRLGGVPAFLRRGRMDYIGKPADLWAAEARRGTVNDLVTFPQDEIKAGGI